MRSERTVTGSPNRLVDDWSRAEWERRLCDLPAAGRYSRSEVEGLPEPVQRYFDAAIAPGTPLATSARFHMKGHIKLGRWLPFRAYQVLNPRVGFLWSARVAGIVAGYDRYLDGQGAMRWKLAGLIDLVDVGGPDVTTSSAGRGGAEGIWIPTALLPGHGVRWTAADDHHITGHLHLGDTPVDIDLTIDDAGQVRHLSLIRWGDPERTGTCSWYRFGGEITANRTFGGLTIPSAGRIGWHAPIDAPASAEFFRYEITSLDIPNDQGAYDD